MSVEERAPVSRSSTFAGVLALLGGVLAAIGSFLPWDRVSDSLGESLSESGMDRDWGVASLVAGIVVVVFGILLITGAFDTKTGGAIALVAGLAVVLVGVLEMLAIQSQINAVEKAQDVRNILGADYASATIEASLSAGLFVAIGGGILAFLGGFWRVTSR